MIAEYLLWIYPKNEQNVFFVYFITFIILRFIKGYAIVLKYG